MARSASAVRLRFCGRPSTSNFANRTLRWALTASTLRNSSAAISWLVAGVARPLRLLERATEREQDAPLRLGEAGRDQHVVRDDRGIPSAARRRPVQDEGATEAQHVAVTQPAPSLHALAVHVRAVSRQPVVDEHAIRSDPLHLGMQARHLRVPAQRDVCRSVAADPDRFAVAGEGEQPVIAGAVAVHQEGSPFPLGIQLDLQLGGRRRLGS